MQNRKVIDIARDLLKISRKGLNKRSRLDSWSQDETQYLSTLEQIVDSGITPAENKLAAFRERWDFNVNSKPFAMIIIRSCFWRALRRTWRFL